MKGTILTFLFLAVPGVVWAQAITIGTISDEPSEEMGQYLPMAHYLAKELASEGITEGKVVITSSIDETAQALRKGKLDLYFDSPYPTLAVQRLAATKFLLRRWKKGVEKYRTVIFVRKESGIRDLGGLKGKIVAFEEPFSTTGYFIPKMMFAEKGIRVVPKSEGPAQPNEVAYHFSGEDENTMLWVLRRKVDGGAMDNYKFEKEAKGGIDRLTIVASSSWLPRHIVSYRSDLPARLVSRVKEVLLQMEQSERGREVLESFEKTTRFDALPPSALDEMKRYGTQLAAEPSAP